MTHVRTLLHPLPAAIDTPSGFLYEWWSVFWDVFIARANDKGDASAFLSVNAR
jgi:hypothetical protein